MPPPEAVDFVSGQRLVLAAQLSEWSAQTSSAQLPLLPHLQHLPCPHRFDTEAATDELLGGLEFPERQAFLRVRVAKLAAMAGLLRATHRTRTTC